MFVFVCESIPRICMVYTSVDECVCVCDGCVCKLMRFGVGTAGMLRESCVADTLSLPHTTANIYIYIYMNIHCTAFAKWCAMFKCVCVCLSICVCWSQENQGEGSLGGWNDGACTRRDTERQNERVDDGVDHRSEYWVSIRLTGLHQVKLKFVMYLRSKELWARAHSTWVMCELHL